MATNIGIGIANAIGFNKDKKFEYKTIQYPGLVAAWSTKGKTNEDYDRDVLRDLTGNGHDLKLSNFAFEQMSGYGGYSMNLLRQWPWYEDKSYRRVINNKVSFVNIPNKINVIGFRINNMDIANTTQYFNINGLKNKQTIRVVYYPHIDDRYNTYQITTNGIVGVKIPEKEILEKSFIELDLYNIENGELLEASIELIPAYPDALIFDGVDDGAIANINKTFDNGYTLISERIRIKNNIGYVFIDGGVGDKPMIQSSFVHEHSSATVFSQGVRNDNINIDNANRINYQTSNSYNGIAINKGTNNKVYDFRISHYNNLHNAQYDNVAFYSAWLFDRELPPEEIESFIKEYIDKDYKLPVVNTGIGVLTKKMK